MNESWTPQVSEGEEVTVETTVYQALGSASMSWTPIPTGIFNSDHARWVGEGLLAWLEENR